MLRAYLLFCLKDMMTMLSRPTSRCSYVEKLFYEYFLLMWREGNMCANHVTSEDISVHMRIVWEGDFP